MTDHLASPTDIVEAFLDAFAAMDFDTALAFLSDDVEYTNIPDRHRLDHGWRQLPVNSVFEVHDGKITVWRDYFDPTTAAKIHDAGAA